jgi:hypothetical protein
MKPNVGIEPPYSVGSNDGLGVFDRSERMVMREPTIEKLRGENAVLAGLLRDCDEVLATIEADDGDEAEKVSDLRMALAYALDPYKREGTLL